MTWAVVYPRVRDVLDAYDKGGIEGLRSYYFDNPAMSIPDWSWHRRLADDIIKGRSTSIEIELNTIIEKLKYPHERYTEGGPTDSDDFQGNEQTVQL
jgi:hypothetical protein